MTTEEKIEETKTEEIKVDEPITRPVGERVVINHGRDYINPIIRVVPNTFSDAQDHEKALHITQGPGMGVSLSLTTIEMIVKWAKGQL